MGLLQVALDQWQILPQEGNEVAAQVVRIDGLCHEGAWENALEAIRALDLTAIVAGAGGDAAAFASIPRR